MSKINFRHVRAYARDLERETRDYGNPALARQARSALTQELVTYLGTEMRFALPLGGSTPSEDVAVHAWLREVSG